MENPAGSYFLIRGEGIPYLSVAIMNRIEKIRLRVAARTASVPWSDGSRDDRPGLVRGGVYCLPNGEEVVCGAVGGLGRCFLYHPLAWQGRNWVIQVPIAYEVMADGQVQTGGGAPTGWRFEDLRFSRMDEQRQAS